MKKATQVKIGDIVQEKNGTVKIKVTRIEHLPSDGRSGIEDLILFYGEGNEHLPVKRDGEVMVG